MTQIPFTAGTRTFGLMMVGISVAEIVAVELMVPWAAVRVTLTVLGVLSLTWLVRFLRVQQRRTHVVTDGQVLLRAPVRGEIAVPLSAISGVRQAHRTESRDGVSVLDDAIALATSSTTNVQLVLAEPTRLSPQQVRSLPSDLPAVRVVRFYADDPRHAVDALAAALERTR